MIWFILQKIGFLIFLILTVFFLIKKKYENLLALYFWGATFGTCYQFYITIWHPTKIISIAFLYILIFRRSQSRESQVIGIIRPFLFLFCLAIFAGDIIALILPGIYAPQISNLSRLFNTNLTFILNIAILFYGLFLGKGFAKRLYPSYCLAIEIAILFGLIHFICLKSGIDFMPILRQDGTVNLEAIAQIGGKEIPRIYGVTGEPKGLGFLICPYLIISMVLYTNEIYRQNSKLYHIVAFVLGSFILINTYSSAVIMTTALIIPILLIITPLGKTILKTYQVVWVIIFISLLYALYINVFPEGGDLSISDNIYSLYDRSFGRAHNEISNNRQEAVIIDWFLNESNWLYALFGYGPGQYTFHIPGQTIGTMLLPVQSGLVLAVADFGILGICLLIYLIKLLWDNLKLAVRNRQHLATAFTCAAITSFIGSMTYGAITSCFIYLMIALFACYDSIDTSHE